MRSVPLSGILVIAACGLLPAQENPETKPLPESHTVVEGDTLWDLAQGYLGNPFRWPDIWNLNRGIVKNPDLIYPGQKLSLGAKEAPPAPPPQEEKPEPEAKPAPAEPETPPAAEAEPAPEPASAAPARQVFVMPQAPSHPAAKEIGKVTKRQDLGKADGSVARGMEGKWLSEAGEKILLRFRKPPPPAAGTLFTVHRKYKPLLDTQGDDIPEEESLVLLETIGVVEVTGQAEGSRAWARIVAASNAIEAGQTIHLWQEVSR